MTAEEALRPFSFELRGHVPSKKNQWRPRRGGGIVLDRKARAEIDPLLLQAAAIAHLWGLHHLEHPRMRVTFYVTNQRSDRDNKLSTLMDILQRAGILKNDNIAHFNGEVTLMPAQISQEEKTVIEIG